MSINWDKFFLNNGIDSLLDKKTVERFKQLQKKNKRKRRFKKIKHGGNVTNFSYVGDLHDTEYFQGFYTKQWLDNSFASDTQYVSSGPVSIKFKFRKKDLWYAQAEIMDFVRSKYPAHKFKTFVCAGTIVMFTETLFISCSVNTTLNTAFLDMYGQPDDINVLGKLRITTVDKPTVKWFFTTESGLQVKAFEIDSETNVNDNFYPYINEGLNNYFDRYRNSSASVMILIGEPGTGKTSFVRQYIKNYNVNCFYTFDESVNRQDKFYIDFLSDPNAELMVVEDADILLSSREMNNAVMSKFLNASEGLVKVKNKKIIFTTNLERINNIDEAIMRPGRCFDVAHFRKLTTEEANVLCENNNLPEMPMKDSGYTIGEIFHRGAIKQHKTRGFL